MKFTNIIWWGLAVSLIGLVIYTWATGTSPFEAAGLDRMWTTIIFVALAIVAIVVPRFFRKKD